MLFLSPGRVLRAGVASGADPYWANVVLLMGMEEAGSPQAFVDESSFARAMTIVGNTKPDTAQFKFGAQSARFDGASDEITAADSTAWLFGAAVPFTIEAWVRFASLPTAESGCVIVGHYNSTVNQRSWVFQLNTVASPTELTFVYSLDGTANAQVRGNWGPVINTWYHLAVTRQAGGTMIVFVDGVAIASDAGSASAFHNSTDLLRIGVLNTSAGSRRWMDGWIDELRITNGVARYVGNFTPPTAAFPRG